MTLSTFTVTIITKEDSPYNVIPNAPIEIRARLANGSSGGLSLIYEDQAGTIPITQTGATADTLGQFSFFATANNYNAVYNNNGTPVTIAVDVGVTGGILNSRIISLNPKTLVDAVNDATLIEGDALNIKERTLGNGGGAVWDVVLASSVVTNTWNIVQCVGVPALALVLRIQTVVNIMQVGAVGDGINDDSDAVQAAVDIVQNGGSVYVPKTKWGQTIKPQFRITKTINVTQGDITIYGDPASEFTGGFICEEAISIMFDVKNPGVRFTNLAFFGDGINTKFGTSTAIYNDRRSTVGNTDNAANLDLIVDNCRFSDVHTSVHGFGRNVNVDNCLHTHVKVGVRGSAFIDDDLNPIDMRGWRIVNNRFHSVGWQYGYPGTTETLPITFGTWDSWCIIMPSNAENFRHLEVTNNNFDRGFAGFYKGQLAGANIANNTGHDFNGAFVYGFAEAIAFPVQKKFPSKISGNLINNRVSYDQPYDVPKAYGIWATECDVLSVVDNSIRNTIKEAIKITNSFHLNVSDNNIRNAGQTQLDGNPNHPALTLDGCIGVILDADTINSEYGAGFNSEGINLVDCSNVAISTPSITNCIKNIEGTPEMLQTGDNYGLGWVNPPLTAPFAYNAGPGYQRMIDGTTIVNLRVLGNSASSGSVIFTLPAGARPTVDVKQNGVGSTQPATISILTSGAVSVSYTGTTSPLYNIDMQFTSA